MPESKAPMEFLEIGVVSQRKFAKNFINDIFPLKIRKLAKEKFFDDFSDEQLEKEIFWIKAIFKNFRKPGIVGIIEDKIKSDLELSILDYLIIIDKVNIGFPKDLDLTDDVSQAVIREYIEMNTF